jgi:hypothetical protein
MAKVQEQIFIIKLSKLLKEGASAESVADEDFPSSLEAAVQQLVDAGIIVEIESV